MKYLLHILLILTIIIILIIVYKNYHKIPSKSPYK